MKTLLVAILLLLIPSPVSKPSILPKAPIQVPKFKSLLEPPKPNIILHDPYPCLRQDYIIDQLLPKEWRRKDYLIEIQLPEKK